MAGGSHLRDHRRIPASRVSPPLPNSSVREPVHTSREPSKPRWVLDITWGGCGGPGPAQSGRRGMEEGLNSSPPGTWCPEIESEQETHSRRASLSLRHKSEKEGVGHTARTHPCTLRSELLQRTRGWEKTHTCLFLYKITYLIWSQIHKIVYL